MGERVVVKKVVSRRAAASLHPTKARALVRDGAERALLRAAAGELRALRVAAPVVIEVEYRNAGEADHAAVVPGAVRFDDRGVRYTAPDEETAYRGFLAGVRLASIVG